LPGGEAVVVIEKLYDSFVTMLAEHGLHFEVARSFHFANGLISFALATTSPTKVIAFMTTPPTDDDDNEALHWLAMARRILSGEIAPQDARCLLNDALIAKPRAEATELHRSL
jgi:hypothetical protein